MTEGIRFKTEKSKKAAAKLRFTEMQANAILDMRLYKLIGLEIDVLMKEHEETLKNIENHIDQIVRLSQSVGLSEQEVLDMVKFAMED